MSTTLASGVVQDQPLKEEHLTSVDIMLEEDITNQHLEVEKYNKIGFLSLKDNRKVKYIPGNIKLLSRLDFLDIEGSNITNLPSEIFNRKKLTIRTDASFEEYGEGDTLGYREILIRMGSSLNFVIEGVDVTPTRFEGDDFGEDKFKEAPLYWNLEFFCKNCDEKLHSEFTKKSVKNPAKNFAVEIKKIRETGNNNEFTNHLDQLIDFLGTNYLRSYLDFLYEEERQNGKALIGNIDPSLESIKLLDLSKHLKRKVTHRLSFIPLDRKETLKKEIRPILAQILNNIFEEINVKNPASMERMTFILNSIEMVLLKESSFEIDLSHVLGMFFRSPTEYSDMESSSNMKYSSDMESSSNMKSSSNMEYSSGDVEFLDEFIQRVIFLEQKKLLSIANYKGKNTVEKLMDKIAGVYKPLVKKSCLGYDYVDGPQYEKCYTIETRDDALYAMLSKMSPRYAVDVIKVCVNTNSDAKRILMEMIKSDANLSEDEMKSYFVGKTEPKKYHSLRARKLLSNTFKSKKTFLDYVEEENDITDAGIQYYLTKKGWLVNKSN